MDGEDKGLDGVEWISGLTNCTQHEKYLQKHGNYWFVKRRYYIQTLS